MHSKSTYVLIPGAGGEAWGWHLVVPLLRSAGHEVIAPDLPASDASAGLGAYTDVVADAIGSRSKVVIVAASMGAYPATMVCERADVASLVLVAPMIPAPGETPGEWWTATGQVDAESELAIREGRDPDAPFDPVTMFLHDLPPEVLEDALAHGGPEQSSRPFADRWPLAAWPEVPTRVIAGLRDRLFPFEFLRSLSLRRLDIDPERIDSGHLVALARPRELVGLLLNGNEGRVPRRRPG
ncbi:alpha/beta fold hydrolase [Archangium violaceum]|uniref:alpha/beta fold hydrolase n=1 Tax=Archangium violaceum TaxID=83451 RepID=UPI002B292061|nr:alpha/beta fold hydrolase [Archangium gephyra]